MFHILRQKKQKGVAALMFAMMVLAIVTIITLFTARLIMTDSKIHGNTYQSAQAYNAAQAGLDYALAYLNENVSAVTTTAAPGGLGACGVVTNSVCLAGGTLQACTPAAPAVTTGPTDPLSNNATYTKKYSCVTAGDTGTLAISSRGVSSDGTATRTISALVKLTGGVFSTYPVIGRINNGAVNSVDLQGVSIVKNSVVGATTTAIGGGTVRLRNSSQTSAGNPAVAPYTCAALKTMPPAPAATTCQDISYSNSMLSGAQYNTASAFETAFIGRSIVNFSPLATVYNFNCSSGNKIFRASTTFAAAGCTNSGTGGTAVTLQGVSGVVYINMGTRTLTLNTSAVDPNFTIGASPVILVINTTGSVTINASTNGALITINGNVYTNSTNFIRLTKTGAGTAATTLNGILFTSGVGQVQGGATVNGMFIASQAAVSASFVNYNAANIINTYGGYYGSVLFPGDGGVRRYGVVAGSWKDF